MVVAKQGKYFPLKARKTKRLSRKNTSGYRGVSFHKQSGLWRAYIGYPMITLGYRDTALEAYELRLEAEKGIDAGKGTPSKTPKVKRQYRKPAATQQNHYSNFIDWLNEVGDGGES